MAERTNPLLATSAAVYFVAALALLFAPRELLAAVGAEESAGLEALLQVLGSALFGFAMLDWASRYAKLGGIYGRPLVIANLAHAGSAFLLLLRVAVAAPGELVVLAPTLVYGALAMAYGVRLFRGPEPV